MLKAPQFCTNGFGLTNACSARPTHRVEMVYRWAQYAKHAKALTLVRTSDVYTHIAAKLITDSSDAHGVLYASVPGCTTYPHAS